MDFLSRRCVPEREPGSCPRRYCFEGIIGILLDGGADESVQNSKGSRASEGLQHCASPVRRDSHGHVKMVTPTKNVSPRGVLAPAARRSVRKFVLECSR